MYMHTLYEKRYQIDKVGEGLRVRVQTFRAGWRCGAGHFHHIPDQRYDHRPIIAKI
jgi:hypothetical protein